LEVEIGKTVVQEQPRQKVCKTPISTSNWAQWHAPVIPAVWEAELRRITIPGQPRQKSLQDLTSTEKSCHTSDGGKLKIGSWCRPAWQKAPISKMTKAKRAGDMAQAVEHCLLVQRP
jgi:hypothetical protein